MKGAFGAEAIGLGYAECVMAMGRLLTAFAPEHVDALGVQTDSRGQVIDPQNRRPWLAEIVGPHPRYRFERLFLPARVDYAQSSSTGNRGVWFWWTLEAGKVYQARHRTSWGAGYQDRYLSIEETSGDLVDLTVEEVLTWLSDRSALTS